VLFFVCSDQSSRASRKTKKWRGKTGEDRRVRWLRGSWRDEIWKWAMGDGACEEKTQEVWREKGLEVGAMEGVDANTESTHQCKILCWG
jgi:hypothetical protein